jgi:hypothetical protein
MTNRHVAHMVGVRMWDCRSQGHPISLLRNELANLSTIGKTIKHAQEWDSSTELDRATQLQLVTGHDKFLLELEKGKATKMKREEQREFHVTLSADSSKFRAAGVILKDGNPIVVENFAWRYKEVEQRSINWKETIVAIKTIRYAMQHWVELFGDLDPTKTEILLGEDNSTALYSINHFHYSRDLKLSGELLELSAELAEMGLGLRAFFTPSKKQSADAPSRDGDFVITEEWAHKCQTHREALIWEARGIIQDL